MNISVIVPCYNEANNIRECLKSLAEQDYGGNYEVVVVDGNSTDETQVLIKEFVKDRSNIRMITEPKKGAAAARNSGINNARHDYVAFTDADCQVPSDWLACLADNYTRIKSKSDSVIGVGGRNIVSVNATDFRKAIEIALDSFPGSFRSVQGRQFKASVFVPSLSTANALYERKKIIEIGYFDESLESEAEDADLNFRLNSRGYKFLFVPDSFVWHKLRLDPKAWFKNMFRYGKGRARLLKRFPEMWNIHYVLPLFFAVIMLLILFFPFSKFFCIGVFYFPAIFFISFFQCRRKKYPKLTLQVMFVYLIQHFAYAAGQIYGLFYPGVK